MPLERTTISAGGLNYATLAMFVGPANHTDVVRVDVSALSTNEVDADGYLKPSVPFRSNGTLVTRLSGVKTIVVAGGAAGALTATGVATADRLVSVIHHDATTPIPVDLTSEFTISDTDEIDNTGGTATSADYLVVTFEVQDQYVYGVTVAPVKVATNNTSGLATATDIDVTVATFGQLNRDVCEDNLARAFNANEVAGFSASGSHLRLLRT